VCGAALIAGATFCTRCGESVQVRKASNLPWYVAGAALVGLIVVLLLPMLRESPAQVGGVGALAPPLAADGTGAPPPLTGTPREQADRLFNRIMQEREAGNLEQAAFFLPMAISAYQQASPLDADGLYHLSMLQTASMDFAAGLQTARSLLEMAPDHLLALATAADAATEAGDSAAARGYWQRFLDVFDAEKDKPLQEYLDHARVLPEYLTVARTFVGG
jgi:tetratricopeptide (TPR) repeat protein